MNPQARRIGAIIDILEGRDSSGRCTAFRADGERCELEANHEQDWHETGGERFPLEPTEARARAAARDKVRP